MSSTPKINFKEGARDVLLPIKHKNLWNILKKQQAVLWTAEEVSLTTDKADFESLSPELQHVILMIMGFFSISDQLVVDNLLDKFMSEVQVPECRAFYTLQGYIETVHSEMYSTLLQLLAPPHHPIQDACRTSPSIGAKAEWARKYMDPEISFSKRLWAFCCFEGVLFQGSFCILYYLKSIGKCHGVTFSNDFIARDEALHALFALEMLNMSDDPISIHDAVAIMKEAVACEQTFINESFNYNGDNVAFGELNGDTVMKYIKSCANGLMGMLTNLKNADRIPQNKMFDDAANPFGFMLATDLRAKSNFFERKVAEYEQPCVGQSSRDNEIALDDNF